MKELIEYIIRELVTVKDAVEVSESSPEDGVFYYMVKVDPKDMGLIIGKQGNIIKAVRKLITVRAIADGVRVSLSLEEPAKQPEA